MTKMVLALRYGIWLVVLVLITALSRAEAQQTPKLTPVNYGTITISALHWPYLIAEQEGMLQREGIEIKRVMGGTLRLLPRRSSQALRISRR